jgi:hypothetical protein
MLRLLMTPRDYPIHGKSFIYIMVAFNRFDGRSNTPIHHHREWRDSNQKVRTYDIDRFLTDVCIFVFWNWPSSVHPNRRLIMTTNRYMYINTSLPRVSCLQLVIHYTRKVE